MLMKIQLGVCGVHTLVSFLLTISFAIEFWDGWSFAGGDLV